MAPLLALAAIPTAHGLNLRGFFLGDPKPNSQQLQAELGTAKARLEQTSQLLQAQSEARLFAEKACLDAASQAERAQHDLAKAKITAAVQQQESSIALTGLGACIGKGLYDLYSRARSAEKELLLAKKALIKRPTTWFGRWLSNRRPCNPTIALAIATLSGIAYARAMADADWAPGLELGIPVGYLGTAFCTKFMRLSPQARFVSALLGTAATAGSLYLVKQDGDIRENALAAQDATPNEIVEKKQA
ncbi:hypothetical protein EBZ39_19200 [bacterium]|nr:hypothetical protein [bacterium]